MGKNKVKVEEEEEGDTFVVEVILAAKVVINDDPAPVKKRKRSKSKGSEEPEEVDLVWDIKDYEVKWAGYPETETTWEPEKNLGDGCKRLLGSFWQAVGLDDKDYPLDSIVRPPKSWIKKEKERFAKDWDKDKRRVRSLAPEAEESDDVPEEPKSLIHANAQIRKKRKVHKSAPVVEDSDSEDSEPLLKKRRKSQEPSTSTLSKNSKTPSKKRSKKSTPTPSTSREPRRKAITIPSSPPRPPKGKRKRIESPLESSPEPSEFNTLAGGLFDSPPPSPVNGTVTHESPQPPPLPTRPRHAPPPPPAPAPPLPLPTRKQSYSNAAPPAGPPTGISTKQRLAQDALEARPPKQAKHAAGSTHQTKTPSLSRTTTGSTTMMHTGFRKTSSSILPHRSHPEPTLASLNAPPESPPTIRPDHKELPMSDSPTSHLLFPDSNDLFGGDTSDFGNDMSDGPVVRDTAMSRAEQFLDTVMPLAMAAPYPDPEKLGEASNISYRPPPARSALSQAEPKNWSWTGALKVACGEENLQFDVIIEDETEIRPTNFRFSLVLGDKTDIRVDSFYDMVDARSMFRACKPPAYRAFASRQKTDSKAGAWSILMQYMNKNRQVAIIPLILDGNLIGHMLLHPTLGSTFPTTQAAPTQKADSFSLILLPWSLTQEQIQREAPLTVTGINDVSRAIDKRVHALKAIYDKIKKQQISKQGQAQWDALVKTRPVYQLAIQTMGFDWKIFDYLTSTNRSWAILSEQWVSKPRTLDLESQLLVSILHRITTMGIRTDSKGKKRSHAIKPASGPETAGILFIHIGVLRYLDKFPFFRNKILSTEHVRMYMYGTHPSFSPDFWGVREIYPCGGVVTFTPSAILQNSFCVMLKLREIYEHPLWTVYVHPTVVGMLAALCNTPQADVVSNQFKPLLRAISKGEIAMLDSPPDRKKWFGTNDRRLTWMRENTHGTPLSEDDALARGRAAFHSVFANTRESEWEARIEELVTNDLKRMQIQPILAKNYRRYVVFTAAAIAAVPQGSVERIPPVQFDFKDDFNLS